MSTLPGAHVLLVNAYQPGYSQEVTCSLESVRGSSLPLRP